MGFIDNVERQTLVMRQAILAHRFVTGVGDGTLPVEKFKYYVLQDYAYLVEYSRALALASAMALHRSFCERFGISAADLEATAAAPSTLGSWKIFKF